MTAFQNSNVSSDGMASLFVSGLKLQLSWNGVNQNNVNSILLAIFQDRQTCKACVPLVLGLYPVVLLVC